MSSINGVGNPGNTLPVQKTNTSPVQKQVPADAPAQNPVTDTVELSGASTWLAALKTNNIRTDLVTDVKAQIAAGTYENDQKLTVATGRLLDDLLK